MRKYTKKLGGVVGMVGMVEGRFGEGKNERDFLVS